MAFRKFFLAILISPVLIINLVSQDYPIGVNLVSQGAFVDIIKHTNRYNNCDQFDELGWPMKDFQLVLMDGRPATEWNGTIDDPEEYRVDHSGTYSCSFKGLANISLYGSGASIENQSYADITNTTTFDLVVPGPPGSEHGLVILTFSDTQRSNGSEVNTGIAELRVIRPGYPHNTKQTFTNEYINLCKAANFACYRYYNVLNIWDGEPVYPEKTLWENRKTPFDATQKPMDNLNGKLDAWCWEHVVELANILNKDIWINVKISCDSDYVTKLAEFLNEKLNPGINIYVENSNEVWGHDHMTHGPYNLDQAMELGISFQENYARRTHKLSQLFASVFGTDQINKRIRVVLAGQHAWSDRYDQYLPYLSNNFGPPKDYIYALSTALYFGSSNPNGNVEEINQGMIVDINEQIDDPEDNRYRGDHLNKAKDWEFPGGCTSYEGGPHLPAQGILDNLDNKIEAHRTFEMKDILKRNYKEGWFEIGGGLAMHFTLASGYNRYGCWGLTDDYTKPDRNYKMQAIRELAGEWDESGIDFIGLEPEQDIVVYPNPANDIIEIVFKNHFLISNASISPIKIYNLLGKTVLEKENNINSSSVRINVSELQTGVYLLRSGSNCIWFVKD